MVHHREDLLEFGMIAGIGCLDGHIIGGLFKK